MYLSILILPLLGSTVSGLLGRKLGVTGAHIITCTCLILSSILATIAFYEVGICGSPVSIYLVNWVDSEFMTISWEFLFDQLTVSMYIPILYISSLIHIFSTDYMSEDPHNQRFFSYLSLFTFFMLLLVSGANFFAASRAPVSRQGWTRWPRMPSGGRGDLRNLLRGTKSYLRSGCINLRTRLSKSGHLARLGGSGQIGGCQIGACSPSPVCLQAANAHLPPNPIPL